MYYPFTLDDFQQQAVARVERAESVFVAAHTSAGKAVGKCFNSSSNFENLLYVCSSTFCS